MEQKLKENEYKEVFIEHNKDKNCIVFESGAVFEVADHVKTFTENLKRGDKVFFIVEENKIVYLRSNSKPIREDFSSANTLYTKKQESNKYFALKHAIELHKNSFKVGDIEEVFKTANKIEEYLNK